MKFQSKYKFYGTLIVLSVQLIFAASIWLSHEINDVNKPIKIQPKPKIKKDLKKPPKIKKYKHKYKYYRIPRIKPKYA